MAFQGDSFQRDSFQGVLLLGLAGHSVIGSEPAPSAPRQIDFLFPNLVLLAPPPAATNLITRAPLFTYQNLPVCNLDFPLPNLSILSIGSMPVPIITQQPLELDRPSPPVQKQDFAFPNVALQAFAQLAVKPIGGVIDESRPVVQPRQLDFQFPTVATRIAPPFRPISNQLLDQAPLKYRPIDWQFPNVALQAFAQLAVHPVGASIDESVPAPQVRKLDSPFPNPLAIQPVITGTPFVTQEFSDRPPPAPRQLDFQFPNVANPPTTPLVDNTKIFRVPLFNRPVMAVLPIDAPIPNLLTTTLTTVVVKPTIPQPFSDRPAPQQRVQEFTPPNLSVTAAAQAQVHPVGNAIDETVPLPAPHQLDFAFPNITLPNSAAPTSPVGKVIDESVPRVDPRQLDFQFPNIAALNFAQLQVKPVGSAIDETVPVLQPRQLDFQFSSPVQLAAKVKPVINQFFDRPVATQIPIDAPLPNLLTTTLFVTPAQPIFNAIFERAPVPAQPSDQLLPNILVTLLSTPPGVPTPPPFFMFADRPAPKVQQQDQAYVNRTPLLPPGTKANVEWLVRARRRGMRQGGR